MLVNYKPVGSGNYALLFNEANGDTLETLKGTFTGILQRDPLAGSNAQSRIARGNIVGKTQFRWTSTYATFDAAQAAVAAIDALKLTPLQIQIVEGATVQYLPNAQSEGYEYERQGKSVTHTLNFESDDLTTTAPP